MAVLRVERSVGVAFFVVGRLRVVAADAVVFEDRLHVLHEVDGGENRRAEKGDAGGANGEASHRGGKGAMGEATRQLRCAG